MNNEDRKERFETVAEGNAFYEIDLDCVERKKKKIAEKETEKKQRH